MENGKVHEYKFINNRAYARITTPDGKELWRTRSSLMCRSSWECEANECNNMDEFIKLFNETRG